MLPGFRFLFAAITLSVSILVFGLGAAALLRAAHEEFASNSSWRAAPEQPIIAQQNDQAKPVLAMLRFDPPHPVVKTREPAPAQEATPAAVTEAPALASSAEKNAVALPAPEAKTAEAKTAEAKSAEAKPAETKPAEAKLTDVKPTDVTTVAALETKDAALPAETTKTEDPPAAAVVTNDTKPTPVVATDASVKADEAAREDTKVAALDAAKPSAGLVPPATDIASAEIRKLESAETEPAKTAPVNPDATNTEIAASESAKPDPTAVAPSPASDVPAADPIARKIATLGGPAVTIEEVTPKKADDQAERSAKAQRRAEARKARRRAALRARRQALAQQAAQLAANPFAPVQPPTPARQATARTVQPAQ